MKIRLLKGVMAVGAAIAIPLAGVTAAVSPAFAKAVVGTGSATCNIGGTVTFNPPLSQNGSPASKEVVTVSPTLSNCSGGTPSTASGATLTVKPLKIAGTGKPKMAGSCSNLGSSAANLVVKSKTVWANGAKGTKGVINGLNIVANGSGEVGFGSKSGSATGSYAGSLSTTIYFDKTSSTQLEGCAAGTATVSTAMIDSTDSTFTQ